MPRALCLLLLLGLAGCQSTRVEAPEGDVDRRAIYQTIADALPQASLGWGDPPGIIGMTASVKREQPWPEPQRLKATEQGFRLHYEIYRPRDVWVPYSTVKQASYRWLPFPNVALIPLVIVPLQAVRAEIVFDSGLIPGLFDQLLNDIDRLELISKEVGMGGPWNHAQAVKAALNDSAEEHGVGMITVHFDYIMTMLPWIPMGGPAEEAARAFAWAAAHPNEPELPDEPEAETP